jgi:NADH-quinone oxidoreductase subunit N
VVDIIAPDIDLGALAPLLIVAGGALIVLLLDLVVPPERRSFLGYFALGTVLVAIAACVPLWDHARFAYSDMVHIDNFGLFFSIVTLGATALSILLAIDYIKLEGMNFGEYHPLVLFTATGMLLLIIANDLVMLFIGLEVLSIGLYILAGFARGNQRSEESALKYFLLGSFSLGFLVYGTSLVYGASGTTNFTALATALGDDQVRTSPLMLAGLALILVGFGFKLALAPFHAWTPDVYSGAPTSVTAFMSVGTKVATFAALIRLVLVGVPDLRTDWSPALWALAVVTMIVGNLAAVTQRNIKRMLAYSSIGQAGYILVAVVAADSPSRDISGDAVQGVLFYLLAYTFMNLGAFAVVIALARAGEERLDLASDYAGLARRHPYLAAALALFMLSLGGIPPTAGFIAKLTVFRAAVAAGYWPLALVGVVTSMIALAFYLRVIIQMYTRESDEVEVAPQRIPAPLAVVLTICVIVTLQMGILPSLSLDWAQQALFVVSR